MYVQQLGFDSGGTVRTQPSRYLDLWTAISIAQAAEGKHSLLHGSGTCPCSVCIYTRIAVELLPRNAPQCKVLSLDAASPHRRAFTIGQRWQHESHSLSVVP